MLNWSDKQKLRRQQVRGQRARSAATIRSRLIGVLFTWPALVSVVFVSAVSAIALWGVAALDYSVGERVEQPIYARVSFRVPDEQRTKADKEAARASVPSCYTWNASAVTFDRIRSDLMRLYELAATASTFEEFQQALEPLGWPAEPAAYRRLRELANESEDRGRIKFQSWVRKLPLENEFVVRGLSNEAREPKSTTEYIVLENGDEANEAASRKVPIASLVSQGNEKALRGSASDVARGFPSFELKSTVEAVVLGVFREQPTIVYQQERTVQAMGKAEEATPVAMTSYEKGKPFIDPGLLQPADYELLLAQHDAYLAFLATDSSDAQQLRRDRLFERIGSVTLVVILSVGLLAYAGLHQRRIFESRARTISFAMLLLGMVLAARLLDMTWGHLPELILAPCLVAVSILAIVYPRRFALGAICIASVLVVTLVHGDVALMLTLFVGVVVGGHQLNEIRSRTKLISAGCVTAVAVVVAATAGAFVEGHSLDYVAQHSLWAGGCTLLSAFVVSGMLPFIERIFRVATPLSLLEWRDPTRLLLQLLAREAPGTYNHSLVIGTLAEAACERIGANALLAQVGALYHDIGKIPKAEYFAENQEGQINRHDSLAPTMSLLIILGHVKDGIEMAKEYKLPRVLHQFIEEHHGTTVVRYFHHVASEKQPQIASGKHDREVPETEFRYSGPKPRSRESAVVMLCDGVESTVRSLAEPTAGRIENVVHQIVTERLNDGQFDDCDITLREISQVEDSLVKSLCSIYHGRVAYPKSRKQEEDRAERVG